MFTQVLSSTARQAPVRRVLIARLKSTATAKMEVISAAWGETDGKACQLFTIKNANGLSVSFTNYGATLTSIKCPSKASKEAEEVTLVPGYPSPKLENLVKDNGPYMGVTVGRVANRIAKGKFSLDGQDYTLAINNGPNSLHGGVKAYDKSVWSVLRTSVTADKASVTFGLTTADGQEGFPGTVHAESEFVLSAANELTFAFRATVEGKATPINMCNHAYYNLSGGFKENIHDHVLTLPATPYYLPVDKDCIPLGETKATAGTDFDFSTARRVGDRIMGIDGAGQPGYDHCYARSAAGTVKSGMGGELPLVPIAVLEHKGSGRKMTVSTDAPGVQLYTGNWLGEGPAPHKQHWALCLETENYPNAINTPAFPSAVLRPGQHYTHTAVHKFEW